MDFEYQGWSADATLVRTTTLCACSGKGGACSDAPGLRELETLRRDPELIYQRLAFAMASWTII